MIAIRRQIFKIIVPFLPFYVKYHYVRESRYLVDSGGKKRKKARIPYQDFYNSYEKSLLYWVNTGKY